MRIIFLAIVVSFSLAGSAIADVEKIALHCEQQICFRWWPQVEPPVGWTHEREASLRYNFNALSPVGSDFSSAETVMYANAIHRPDVPDEKTLAAFIESDIQKFKNDNPGLAIEALPPLKTADGKTARVFALKPSRQGQWERVAYVEEGEYYMVFVASSRTESGLHAVSQSHESLVMNYRW
jgi:hypothetical protein